MAGIHNNCWILTWSELPADWSKGNYVIQLNQSEEV